ncbi:hypothetical protein N7486_000785 [Penicillium sp. IBT 16267x]|nr:hypothetical protein N7486_000785 [Penicillium sp. IBT 16267x]
MQKVESLVDRARHLSLHLTTETPLDTFHSTVDNHLQKIYESLSTQKITKADFFNHIQRDESSSEGQADPLSSLDAFRAYMKEPASRALGEAKELDLSAPISDYYVSSSHNTYLTGNQLYSDAAASAYTSVLLHGCRSVEIDVWDGEPEDADSNREARSSEFSDKEEKKSTLKSRLKATIKSKLGSEEKAAKELWEEKVHRKGSKPADVSKTDEPAVPPVLGEPRVLHGHTLTKGTSFREICYAIRDAAFVNSDLPVIISFEVHACLEQQQMMVDIVNEAWKGLLVEIPAYMEPAKLPTLGELKKKILIKTKSTPLSHADLKAELEEASEPSDETSDQSVEAEPKPAKPSKVLEALAKLAVYTRAYHFSRFDQPEAKVLHVFSLSEKSAREAHTHYRDALFEHNRCSLMRIYPYALRVTSSNLDPAFHWRRGAQLVALNWQNLDKGMMLNHGMFAGTQGWALKPSGYRSSEGPTDSITRITLELKIEVFAGQDLALPQNHSEKGFRPYLVCELHVEEPEGPVSADRDDASDETEKSGYRRHTKTASGRNPDFEAQGLVFPTVVGIVEELSFVRFKIKNDEIGRDSLAAWTCMRLDQLREGCRFIHLQDSTGGKAGGVLLVRITKHIS